MVEKDPKLTEFEELSVDASEALDALAKHIEELESITITSEETLKTAVTLPEDSTPKVSSKFLAPLTMYAMEVFRDYVGENPKWKTYEGSEVVTFSGDEYEIKVIREKVANDKDGYISVVRRADGETMLSLIPNWFSSPEDFKKFLRGLMDVYLYD